MSQYDLGVTQICTSWLVVLSRIKYSTIFQSYILTVGKTKSLFEKKKENKMYIGHTNWTEIKLTF